jgi:hypothetical protein
MRNRWLGMLAVALAVAPPAHATAQLEVSTRAASIRVGGLLQPQYTASSVDAVNNDAYIRRARLRADVTVNDFLTGRVVTEFGSGGDGYILDADMSLHFSEAFVLSIGQFKRAFDIFELPSPSDLPEIEKDGRIEGYAPGCTGVGSLCSYSRFTEALEFAGRDQGVRVNGTSGSLSYQASITNGTGLNTADENDRKSVSGRLTFAVSEELRVSGQLALHDYVDPTGNATALGLGGELELGTWRDGLHVRAAISGGDNWLALAPVSFDPATFLAFQAIGTYYYRLDGERFEGVEPFGRLSYGDPDTGSDDDAGVLITPGVTFYVVGKNRISANLDIYAPQGRGTEYSLKLQSTLYF